MAICYVVFMTNHFHALCLPDSEQQMADFFRLVNSQISHEVGKLVGWTGGIFKEGYGLTCVTEEPEAQIARLRYLFSRGVKEGLVERPEHWPGVCSAKALLDGSMKMQGTWVNRTELDKSNREYWRKKKLSAALKKKRGVSKTLRPPREREFETKLELELTPLPCWRGLDPRDVKEQVHAIHAEVLVEYADQIGKVACDWKKRLTDKSLRCFRPTQTKRGKRPKFHSASKEQWKIYMNNWESWLIRYEDASRRLRQGIVEALYEFPKHCFLPTGLIPREALAKPPP